MLTALAGIALSCGNPTLAPPKTDAAVSPAVPSKTEMAEKNKATALALMQAVNNHDLDGTMKYIAPDDVDYGDGSGPPAKGADAQKALIQEIFTAFPDTKNDNLIAVADGNRVAIYSDWTGTFKGAMAGMKPTGKSFKTKDVDLFTFNDASLVIEHRSVQSMETVMRQVGAVMKK